MSSRAEVDGPRVVIVGAGVSGCACAGVLATAGVEVLLVSASLDAAGMPAYGPVVPAAGAAGVSRLMAAFGGLPQDLRCAWLADALVIPTPQAGGPHEGRQEEITGSGQRGFAGLAVDPRAVSLRVKWVLELLPTLRFRQGLATGLERTDDGEWAVHTAFGDTVTGSRVVIAVGMALQGRLTVGRQQMGGGRYGEVAADQLCASLAGLGVPLSCGSCDVGTSLVGSFDGAEAGGTWHGWRFGGLLPVVGVSGFEEAPRAEAVGSLGQVEPEPTEWESWESIVAPWAEECRRWLSAAESAGRAPATSLEYSPAVRGVGRDWLTLTRDRRSSGGREDGVQQRLLVPQSAVSAEWQEYDLVRGALDDCLGAGQGVCDNQEAAFPAARSCAPVSGEVEDAYVSRLGYKVSARIVSGAGPAGRLAGFPGLWAVGRVVGARSYAESLLSGIEAAREIQAELDGDGRGEGIRRGG